MSKNKIPQNEIEKSKKILNEYKNLKPYSALCRELKIDRSNITNGTCKDDNYQILAQRIKEEVSSLVTSILTI